jgi:hypothetical protein
MNKPKSRRVAVRTVVPLDRNVEAARAAISRALDAGHPYPVLCALDAAFMALRAVNAAIAESRRKR